MMFLIVQRLAILINKMIKLDANQKEAIEKLKSGSILRGGVGSGKSRTAIAYYLTRECEGSIPIDDQCGLKKMKNPKDLYIITTAQKRDKLEWDAELSPFLLSREEESNYYKVKVVVDSWQNIIKYKEVKNSFFIFDEQRLVGHGVWVKTFLKIAKNNNWILLTATPGDTWLDYIPVFIANGFYKNRTEFLNRHVVYSRFTKFPKVDRYIECGRLIRLRQEITVDMKYIKPTTSHERTVIVPFDKAAFDKVYISRWNIFKNCPITNISELGYILRRVVNGDYNRIKAVKDIITEHPKSIIFYYFDYELEMLKEMCEELDIPFSEWNGHKHEPIQKTDSWVYLVQYTAGAEGWNCTETNVIIFYSQNYSYKIMAQAAGRIDRRNTPFKDLYYYHIRSNSAIDLAIAKSLARKENFNEAQFFSK